MADADDITTPLLIVRPAWVNYYRSLMLAATLVAVTLALLLRSMWIDWTQSDAIRVWTGDHPGTVYLAAAICFAGALLSLLKAALRRATLKLTVYHDRVTLEKGILAKDIKEISCADVRTVNVRQTFSQRMLGIGNLMIATSGTDGYEDEALGVPSPIKIKDMILKQKALTSHASDD